MRGRSSREPEARIYVLPNESVFAYGTLGSERGSLTQGLLDAGAEYGVSVEVDTRERTRPGEMRGGAAPIEGFDIFLYLLAAREALRLADHILDATVEWVLRHRERDNEEIAVTIYGPDEEVLKDVYIDTRGTVVDRRGGSL